MPKPAPKPDPLATGAPVVVLAGPERFLHLDRTRALRAALISAHGEVDTASFDGAVARPADVLDECRSLGLMQTHKLVIVDNAEAMLKGGDDEDEPEAPPAGKRGRAERTAREMFESYAQSPEPAATLVLRATSWRPGNLDKAIERAGGCVARCEPYSPDAAIDWTIDRAKDHHHASLDPDAAALLVDNLGTELGRLDSELGKLALAASIKAPAPGAARITKVYVEKLVGFSREEEAWALQRDLLAGDAHRCLQNLADMLEVSRHSPVLVGMVYVDLARKLDGVARGTAAKETPGSIMKRVKLWGPAADAVMNAGRRLSTDRTARLLRAAIDADVAQKTGRGEPRTILERLTLEFVAAR